MTSTDSAAQLGTTYPDATMRYGATGRQVADVFEPDEPTDSLVLLLHGGLWRDAERTRTWAAARALAEAGHLTASVEHRHGSGQWREAFEDVVAAIEQLQLSGREFTRDNDAARWITLVGHSSGGQLALWAASRHSLPATSRWHGGEPRVTGVVALAPAADLAVMGAQGVGGNAVEEFLGGSQEAVPEAYATADPGVLTPAVPVWILHGADDEVIPAAVSQQYADGHASAQLEIVPGAAHDSWGDPSSASWPRVLAAISALTR